jgi:hypothetical protein
MLKGECVAHHTPLDQAGCTRSLDQSKRHSSPPWLSSFRISASLSACGRSSYPGIFCTVRGLPKRTGFPIDWHFGSFAIDSATHRLCRGCFVVKCKPISVSLSDSVRRTIMHVKYRLRGCDCGDVAGPNIHANHTLARNPPYRDPPFLPELDVPAGARPDLPSDPRECLDYVIVSSETTLAMQFVFFISILPCVPKAYHPMNRPLPPHPRPVLLGQVVAFLGASFSLRASRHLSDAGQLILADNLLAPCHRPDAMLIKAQR